MPSFGRKQKPLPKGATAASSVAVAEHDGSFVGDEVVLLSVDGREDLAGASGEAILYDFYEQLYTVVLDYNRRRVQVPPAAIKTKRATK